MKLASHAAAAGQLDLIGFLLLGLLGSFGHCSAMCSPFVLFVSRRYCAAESSRGVILSAQLWYHSGRIATYAALGAIAGALGTAVELTGRLVGLHRAAAVLAGVTLVLFAASSVVRLRPGSPEVTGLFSRVTRLFRGRVPDHPLATGLLLGLLPCGFLYSALVAAAALGGPLHGATALVAFGLGTAPTLLGISAVDQLVAAHRVLISRLSHAFMFVFGLWFIWRGLSG